MTAEQDAKAIAALLNQGEAKKAFKQAKIAIKRYPRTAFFMNLAGLALSTSGQPREAIRYFQDAVKAQPEFPDAHRNLAQTLVLIGQPDKAVTVLKRHLARSPKDAEAEYLLAQSYSQAEDPVTAESHASRAIELNPRMAKAYNLRAVLHSGFQRYDEALKDYETALSFNPNDPNALTNISLPLARQNRHEDAMKVIEKALAIAPSNIATILRYGVQLNELGRVDEAVQAYRQVLDLAPGHPTALTRLAMIAPAEQLGDVIEQLVPAFNTAPKRGEDRVQLAYGLAEAYKKKRDTDQVHHWLAQANAAQSMLTPGAQQDTFENYQVNLHKRITERFADIIAPDVDGDTAKPTPVFVLGMPRSGTTLTETVLATHPNIAGMGERATAATLLRYVLRDDLPFGIEEARQFAADYRADLHGMPEGPEFFIDKMPENYRLIGFLHMAFPQAKIVHLVRDPRDVAWSIWSNYFTGGLRVYTYDMKRMAQRCNDYKRLMAHWHKVCPGVIHDLKYDDLVSDIGAASRDLAAYIGLDWIPEMAAPHTSKAPVLTASVNQVREPVHTKSIGNWQKHEQELAPFIKALDPGLWPEVFDKS
jgi:tetratricopeptide (TPR) repeat protein